MEQTSEPEFLVHKSSDELGTLDDIYDDEEAFTKEETSGKYTIGREEETSREAEVGNKRKAEEEEENEEDGGEVAADKSSSSAFNYHPLEKGEKSDKTKTTIDGGGEDGEGDQDKKQQWQEPETANLAEQQPQRIDMWENVGESEQQQQFSDDEDDNSAGESKEKMMTDKRRATTSSVAAFSAAAASSSKSASASSSHSSGSFAGKPGDKGSSVEKRRNNGARKMIMSNVKNKLPYALRADRPHFKYPLNYPALDFVDSGDSAFDTMIPEDEFPAGRKKREVSVCVHLIEL